MMDYVGDFKFENVHFAPVTLDPKDGRASVEVFKDANASKNNRMMFQLCRDVNEPIETKYGLDTGDNPDRKGLCIKVKDPATVAALEALDQRILAKAKEQSMQWFKKDLNETQLEARYKPILSKRKPEDDHYEMKVKVKIGNSKVPTAMHLRDPDSGVVRKNAVRVDRHLAHGGAQIVPIVSAYSLWFMGGGSQFGISFQVERMIVTPTAERDELSCFRTSVPLQVAEEPEKPEASEDSAYIPLGEEDLDSNEEITIQGLGA